MGCALFMAVYCRWRGVYLVEVVEIGSIQK
jgi:hypothetical protein